MHKMQRRTEKKDIPQTNKKTTKNPVIIPSKITVLYVESICKEMKLPSITEQRGGASSVNCHCMQLMVQKHQTTMKSSRPV